jgi:PAS domain S-box-containing protein
MKPMADTETITKEDVSSRLSELSGAIDSLTELVARLKRAHEATETHLDDLKEQLENKNAQLSWHLEEMDTVKNYLNNILESVTSGVIVIDLEKRVTLFNRGAESIIGLPCEEGVGCTYREIFGGEIDKEHSALYTLDSGLPLSNQERTFTNKRGEIVPIGFSTSLVTDRSGNPIGVVEIFKDLSQVKKLEAEIQQSKTLAALGEMAASVAHELRNPLGGIGGFAALLERDLPVGDPRRRLAKKIIEGVASLDKIATNLLIYTRPMKPNPRKTTLDGVRRIVSEVASFIDIESERVGRDIMIEKEYSSGNDAVKLDPEMLRQILINLATNAMHAVGESGKIYFGVDLEVPRRLGEKEPSRESARIVFVVSDNGLGMSHEIQEKMFNPFFTTRESGTGLGLAITKKMVQVLDGAIKVDSAPNQGTKVTVILPVG